MGQDEESVLPSEPGWAAMPEPDASTYVPLVPHLSVDNFMLFRVGAVLIPALAIGMYMLSWNEAEGGGNLVQAVLAVLAIPIMWRLGRIKVRTDDTGITIANFFRKYFVPWENAFGVRETNSDYQSPQLILNRGGNIALTAIKNNGRPLDQLDALIQERRAGYDTTTRGEGAPKPRRGRRIFLVVISALLVLMTLAVWLGLAVLKRSEQDPIVGPWTSTQVDHVLRFTADHMVLYDSEPISAWERGRDSSGLHYVQTVLPCNTYYEYGRDRWGDTLTAFQGTFYKGACTTEPPVVYRRG